MLMATREVPIDPRLASVQHPDDDPYDADDMSAEITARSYDCFTRLSRHHFRSAGGDVPDERPENDIFHEDECQYLQELFLCDQAMIGEAIDLAIFQWSEE